MASAGPRGYAERTFNLRWWEIRGLIYSESSPLKAAQRAILAALWDAENSESGLVWLSIDTLASKTGLSVTVARRHLRLLEAQGVVVLVRAGGGRRRSNRCRVDWSRLAELSGHHADQAAAADTEEPSGPDIASSHQRRPENPAPLLEAAAEEVRSSLALLRRHL